MGLTDNPLQWFWHLLLPWIAAALPFAGAYVQIVRASLLEAIDEEWVRAARAKGLSEKRVLRHHVLRNGLMAPVNVWGLDFSHAFGDFALYVEVIFQVPGVGLLPSETLGGLDLPPSSGWRSTWASSSWLPARSWMSPRLARPSDSWSRPVHLECGPSAMNTAETTPPDTMALLHGLWMTPGALANLRRHPPTEVDFGKDDRAPMLLIAFENDHVIPPKATRHNAKKYAGARALTAFTEFPGRPHFPAVPGWEEVADAALAWALDPSPEPAESTSPAGG